MNGLKGATHPVDRLLGAAARRAVAGAMLRGAGLGASAACVIVAALVVAERLLPAQWSAWPLAIAAATCVATGAAIALLRLPRRREMAHQLDRSLSLDDRLATVAALADGARADRPFADLVRAEANRRVAGLRASDAVPLAAGRAWVGALGALLLLALVAWLVPWRSPHRPAAAALDADERAARIAAASEIRAAVERFVPGPVRPAAAPEPAPAIRDRLEELDRIAAQLDPTTPIERAADADQTQDRAAALLEELAALRDAEALAAAADADEAAQRLSSLGEGVAPPPVADAGEFTKALRDGRFDDAAAALEALERAASQLSPGDREALAEYFRAMAERTPKPEEMAAAEQDRSVAAPPHEEAAPVKRQGEEKPPAAQTSANETAAGTPANDKPSGQAPDPPAESGGGDDRKLREALEEVAQRFEGERRASGDAQARSTAPTESGQASSPQPRRAEDRRQETQPGTGEPGTASPDANQRSSNRIGETASGDTKSASKESRSSDGAARTTPNAQPPQDSPATAPSTSEPQATGSAPRPTSGDRDLASALREVARHRDSAAERAQEARALREQADRVAGRGVSPQGQQQLERWSRALAREAGATSSTPQEQPAGSLATKPADAMDLRPGGSRKTPDGGGPPAASAMARSGGAEGSSIGTGARAGSQAGVRSHLPSDNATRASIGTDRDDLDLRGTPDAAREVIAEWFDDLPPSEGAGAAVQRQLQRVEAIRRAAERAIERRDVPPRYHHLLRRYFGRFGEPSTAPAPATGDPFGSSAPETPPSASGSAGPS